MGYGFLHCKNKLFDLMLGKNLFSGKLFHLTNENEKENKSQN